MIIRTIKNIISQCVRFANWAFYRFVPIDDKLAIFVSFHGTGYSDNPKAIYEKMLQDPRFDDFRFIWFIKKKKSSVREIPGAIIKPYYSPSYFFYMARAKYWVINCKMPTYIKKKDKQVYLQTWHGTPLKRLGCDIEVSEGMTFYRSKISFEEMCETYRKDSEKYNFMITPNRFCTEIFPKAFLVEPEKLIETGYPRNDFITNTTENEVEEIKKKWGIPLDKKVVFYAPTWRDTSFVASGYTFELKADFRKWKEVLGEDYVVVFKPHYLIINKYEHDEELEGFLYSIPASAEINQFYVISDVLVTDYSSVFFDYSVLNRPIYFYMYDRTEYQDQMRGFYLDVDTELPGDIYTDEVNMLEEIKNNIYDYSSLEEFNKKFNHMQDGKCTERVIDIVFEK